MQTFQTGGRVSAAGVCGASPESDTELFQDVGKKVPECIGHVGNFTFH